MGYSARIVADARGLTEFDALHLAEGLARLDEDVPIHGVALQDGQPFPYTLDLSMASTQGISPWREQFAIAGIVLASFVTPLWHLAH